MRSTSASTSFTEPAAGFKITNVLAISCEREREEIVLLRTTPQRITVVEAGKIDVPADCLQPNFHVDDIARMHVARQGCVSAVRRNFFSLYNCCRYRCREICVSSRYGSSGPPERRE